MSTAAATRMSPPPAQVTKGTLAPLASRRRHYRVNIRGDRGRIGRELSGRAREIGEGRGRESERDGETRVRRGEICSMKPSGMDRCPASRTTF